MGSRPVTARPTGAGPARPSRAVVRRRRAVALLLLLGVLGLAGWGVTAVVTAIGEASRAAAARPTPIVPADPRECRELDADLTAVPAGRSVEFTVTLTNDGDAACLTDAGRSALVLTVESGSDRVWSSGDCPAEPASRRLLLDVGDSSQATVTWNGVRSAAGCPAGQPTVSPGTYRVTAAVAGVPLPGAQDGFTLG